MAGLDDLFAQIPTSDIASKIGVNEADVNKAVQLLVPVLVGGLHQNAQDPDHASKIESAAGNHAASGLLDGGVSVDQVDQKDGQQAVAKIFGGNDVAQVATALAGGGAGNSDLLKQLLPILAPIVLAYVGKQLSQKNAPAPANQEASGGGLNDVLGSILGGMSGGNKSLGSVLGNALGSKAGDILGGLFGGKK
ncbi:MAG: DUF937 domain-containing protein [Mycobacterium sp.]